MGYGFTPRGSFLSAAPREGVAAERNPKESAVLLALHFPSHQGLHASTIECLPGGLPYPSPGLPKVGRPLLHLVAGEDDQLKGLLSTVHCLLGPVLDPH